MYWKSRRNEAIDANRVGVSNTARLGHCFKKEIDWNIAKIGKQAKPFHFLRRPKNVDTTLCCGAVVLYGKLALRGENLGFRTTWP